MRASQQQRLRDRERDALAPLLVLAHAKSTEECREWLDDLRKDAPTVVARLESLLIDPHALPTVVPNRQIAHATPLPKRTWALRLNWMRS